MGNMMSLLYRIGSCEWTLGRYKAAGQTEWQLLNLREEIQGKEHPQTLTTMNKLANALSRQGKYAEAEMMHRETLALREKILGKEHPDTLMTIDNIATTLSRRRKHDHDQSSTGTEPRKKVCRG